MAYTLSIINTRVAMGVETSFENTIVYLNIEISHMFFDINRILYNNLQFI